MNKLVLISAIALMAQGCATKVWTKDGASQRDFATDTQDCQVKANQAGYAPVACNIFQAGTCNYKDFLQTCMTTKGWSEQRKE